MNKNILMVHKRDGLDQCAHPPSKVMRFTRVKMQTPDCNVADADGYSEVVTYYRCTACGEILDDDWDVEKE